MPVSVKATLLAASVDERLRDPEHPLLRHLALIGAAERHRDHALAAEALLARAAQHAPRPASDSSIERFTFFWLCVSLADRKTLISWKRSRSSSALSRPFSLGIRTETDTSSGMSARRRTSAPSASCRDHVGAHEARDLQPAQAVLASSSTSRTLSSVRMTSGSFWKPSGGRPRGC